jgi:hypothetical protein
VLCEYCIITANVPLIGSRAAAVLLRTIADDRLFARVREDLDSILDQNHANIVRATLDMFIEQSAAEGGAAILRQLEDTLSNFLTISPRIQIADTDGAATLLVALTSAHFSCHHT